MKIEVVGLPDEPVHDFASAEAMIQAAPTLGWIHTGNLDDPQRADQLQGMPQFEQLCGPLGSIADSSVVRYETWSANQLYAV